MSTKQLKIGKLDEKYVLICLSLIKKFENDSLSLKIRDQIASNFYINHKIIESILLLDSSQNNQISAYKLKINQKQNKLQLCVQAQRIKDSLFLGKIYKDEKLSYEGEIVNFVPHGKGKQYTGMGSIIYTGNFHNDKYQGQGTLYYQDITFFFQPKNQTIKKAYEGEFYQNFKFGQGILYDQNGKIKFQGNFVYNQYEKPLQLKAAAQQGDLALVKEFIENQGLSEKEKIISKGEIQGFQFSETICQLIHAAMDSGSIELIKYLLNKGYSLQEKLVEYKIYDKNSIKYSATAFYQGFQQSLKTNNLEFLKYLINYGGDPNISHFSEEMDYEQIQYPLIDAIRKNSYSFVKCLLKGGADPNCIQSYKESESEHWDHKLNALHYAVQQKDSKILRILIKYGVNMNDIGEDTLADEDDDEYDYELVRKDYYKCTPLNIAVRDNFIDKACILLLNNVRIDINIQKNNKSISNYQLSKSKEMKQLLEYKFSNQQLAFLHSSSKKILILIICSLKKKQMILRKEILNTRCLKYFLQFRAMGS